MLNNESTLTNLQLTAIRGRVAQELANCKNIEDKKYKAYILVSIADYAKKNYVFFLDCVKEYLEEEIVNEAFLFKSTLRVPTIYWINKNKEDILLDKRDKNILKSVFVSFMNRVTETDVESAVELLQEFKQDDRLAFLTDIYFYLEDNIKSKNLKNNDALAKFRAYVLLFNNFNILDVREELKKECGINKYLIKKVIKGNGNLVTVKEFDTEQEAEDYRQMVMLEYPDLSNDFEFIKEIRKY